MENKLNITHLLFPLPMNFTLGVETFIIEENCKFYFNSSKINKNDEMFKIFEIYNIILNKNRKSENKYNSFLFKNSNCNIPINIIVKNSQIIKYSKNYQNELETYGIEITINSKNNLNIHIESLYLNGLIRALETLSQILYFNKKSFQYEIYNLPLIIYDKPIYNYRGVMIDTSRHYISIDKIKELIDGMMYTKLNILHWHLTDDEYFGFMTDLLENNLEYVYTKSQIEKIKEYAKIRGVTIIPEIDNPSHTRSWKDLKKINEEKIVITKPENGVLDPSKQSTYQIVENILNETIKIFSENSGDFIHLGGDEVLSIMWNTPEIIEFMIKNNFKLTSDLENFYFNKIRNILQNDKNYIYWISDQENNYKNVYDLNNSVLMYWGLFEKLKNHLDNFPDQKIKRQLILTPGDFVYLDCGSGNKYGNKTWCGEYKTWNDIYNIPIFKSYNNFTVLGSEVVLFGELAEDNSFIGKIFPRAAALSERLWRENKEDIKNVFIRLINHNKRLKERNINTISFTTQLCENEPFECIENLI